MLKSIVKKILSVSMQRILQKNVDAVSELKKNLHLAYLWWRLMANPPRTSGVERCFDYTVHINDGSNFYIPLQWLDMGFKLKQ